MEFTNERILYDYNKLISYDTAFRKGVLSEKDKKNYIKFIMNINHKYDLSDFEFKSIDNIYKYDVFIFLKDELEDIILNKMGCVNKCCECIYFEAENVEGSNSYNIICDRFRLSKGYRIYLGCEEYLADVENCDKFVEYAENCGYFKKDN